MLQKIPEDPLSSWWTKILQVRIGEENSITMTSKFFSIAAALVAIAIAAPSVVAKPYSPAQFNAELKKRIGKKTGNAAISAAAGLLQSALADNANKSKVITFTTSVNNALKPSKVVSPALKAAAAEKVANALTRGYFNRSANLTDARFRTAYGNVLKTIPTSSRNASTSQKLYNALKGYLSGRGVPVIDTFNFFDAVRGTARPLPQPVS